MGCCCTDTRVRGVIAKANTNRLKTASPGQRNAALTTWLLKPLQVMLSDQTVQLFTMSGTWFAGFFTLVAAVVALKTCPSCGTV